MGETAGPEILINAWFDIRCPWCYLSLGRLDRGLALVRERRPDVRVTVSHHSFQLAPDMPDRFDGDEADYLHRFEGVPRERAENTLPALTALAATEGVDLRFDRLVQVNTRPAHRLFQWSKSLQREREALDALFPAYFTRGEDLADPNTLAALGASLGLDRDTALAAVSDPHWDEAIDADHVRAQMLGATGVPFFLINAKYRFSGAREPEVLAEVLLRVAGEHAEE